MSIGFGFSDRFLISRVHSALKEHPRSEYSEITEITGCDTTAWMMRGHTKTGVWGFERCAWGNGSEGRRNMGNCPE